MLKLHVHFFFHFHSNFAFYSNFQYRGDNTKIVTYKLTKIGNRSKLGVRMNGKDKFLYFSPTSKFLQQLP